MTLERAKRIRRWMAIAGAVAGLICASLPHEYRIICHTIANVCTGGTL